MRLLTILAALPLAACTTTKTVPVPTPVPVPGPVQYVPVPDALTRCEDTGEPPALGQPLGELFAWAQRTRAASVACAGKMAEIRALTLSNIPPDSR
jgi:hypothetical protein